MFFIKFPSHNLSIIKIWKRFFYTVQINELKKANYLNKSVQSQELSVKIVSFMQKYLKILRFDSIRLFKKEFGLKSAQLGLINCYRKCRDAIALVSTHLLNISKAFQKSIDLKLFCELNLKLCVTCHILKAFF